MRCASMIASDVREKEQPIGESQLRENIRMSVDTAAYDIANRDRHSEVRPNQSRPCLWRHCRSVARQLTSRESRRDRTSRTSR